MSALTTTSELERHRRMGKNGQEYWMGRDIQKLLEYADWTNFENVIEKAKTACVSAGLNPKNHIRETTEVIGAGKGAKGKRKTYFLSRYGCYLIAMNGDPSKEQIALAQTYFAVQTRRQEIADQLTAEEQRIVLRDQLAKATMKLNSVAKHAGVQQYGLFHDAGYRGLYGMGLSDIKRRKGLQENEQLFDRAGRSELAANFFRATQATEKIDRLDIKGQDNANSMHESVGRSVRTTIKSLGNILPEDLPAEPHIRAIQKRNRTPKQIADSLLLPSGGSSLPSNPLASSGG
jgi:DNA-damage-inducible protein D